MVKYALVKVENGKVEWVTENNSGYWGFTTHYQDSWKFDSREQAQRVADEIDENLTLRTLHLGG